MGLPSGELKEEYAGHKHWSRYQWAWEFLRRNKDFQELCCDIDQLPEKKQEKARERVAKQFGLRVFRDAREDYKETSKPKFKGYGVVYAWRLEKKGKKSRERALEVGEVLVLFDLDRAVDNSKLIDKQLERAKNALEMALAEYARRQAKEVQERQAPDWGSRLVALRFLDLKAGGRSEGEARKFLTQHAGIDLKRTENFYRVRDNAARLSQGGHYDCLIASEENAETADEKKSKRDATAKKKKSSINAQSV